MKKKNIPKFKDEAQEREFWHSHDSTEYLEWDSAERIILPKLKPSLKTISLRLPENLLNELKLLANKKDVPYQSLLKMFLAERVQAELKKLLHNNLEGDCSINSTCQQKQQ
jgi:predicted DNA binding CopG/RHH family protein